MGQPTPKLNFPEKLSPNIFFFIIKTSPCTNFEKKSQIVPEIGANKLMPAIILRPKIDTFSLKYIMQNNDLCKI